MMKIVKNLLDAITPAKKLAFCFIGGGANYEV